ncbi:hypothetical protein PP714_10850, partial [Lacticaseibacillus paracasei]|nr:hypothetical protein [Lacticaseibacillus paracasei]
IYIYTYTSTQTHLAPDTTNNGAPPRPTTSSRLREDPMEEKPSIERVQTVHLARHACGHVLIRVLQANPR